ncbi:glycosyltransferase family 2 protein [Pelagibacterales bacterium SAG-MED15]|nr:glycosyltransferase family 2 protein [Pelagibacterales bacterium SAG-MED15]
MNFSIIINTHNQSKFIYECIKSCENQTFSDYEIIVVDTSKKALKKKNFKRVKYFHIKEKSKSFPVLNQMHQILYGLKKSKGKFICLLDGDDKFKKSKLKKLSIFFKKNQYILNQDIPIIFTGRSKYLEKIKSIKNNFFFKKLFINWPQIFGTSTITCNREILELFFKVAKPFKWKYLAIDAKIMLFARYKFGIKNEFHGITFKRKHSRNLDETFSNFFSIFFWKRRKMQLDYNHFLTKKRTINIDYVVTNLINFFL